MSMDHAARSEARRARAEYEKTGREADWREYTEARDLYRDLRHNPCVPRPGEVPEWTETPQLLSFEARVDVEWTGLDGAVHHCTNRGYPGPEADILPGCCRISIQGVGPVRFRSDLVSQAEVRGSDCDGNPVVQRWTRDGEWS